MHSANFYATLAAVLEKRAHPAHDQLILELVMLRRRDGRLFCLGVGGGAANAAHAASDFRKLCGIEAYAPADGVAELTARANDEGWATIFGGWLRVSRLSSRDAIFVFSVGGGQGDVSTCICEAVQLARQVEARVLGVVGLPTGATALMGHAVVVTGVVGDLLTPVTEAAQVAVLHALVSDPRLKIGQTKW